MIPNNLCHFSHIHRNKQKKQDFPAFIQIINIFDALSSHHT